MSQRQVASFWVGDRLFGIDVCEVQEITPPLVIAPLRKAPHHILGLVNLRGQLSTAVGLNELFEIAASQPPTERMAVVCQGEGALLSLLVDHIGDVLEIDTERVTQVPRHLEVKLRDLISGVYQSSGPLLSVLEINRILNHLVDKEKREYKV